MLEFVKEEGCLYNVVRSLGMSGMVFTDRSAESFHRGYEILITLYTAG